MYGDSLKQLILGKIDRNEWIGILDDIAGLLPREIADILFQIEDEKKKQFKKRVGWLLILLILILFYH